MQIRNTRWQFAALILLVMLFQPALAMELEDAQSLALERDATLAALDHRIEATRADAVAESALPDPELFIGAEGLPVNDPLAADMMTQYNIGLRQQIPTGRSRNARQRAATHQARVLHAQGQARRLEVLREVTLAWSDWVAAGKALEVAQSSRSAFAGLVELTEARYRAGGGRQSDISQAGLELALLDQRILEQSSAVDDAASRLQRWTGIRPASGAAADWAAPLPSVQPEQRLASLATHPAVLALQAAEDVQQARMEEVEASYRPHWNIEAGWGHSRSSDALLHRRDSDRLFAMVSFNLPLFTSKRQDQRLRAAQAEQAARGQDALAELHRLRGAMEREVQRQQQYARRLQGLEEQVLPAARNTLEAVLVSYRSDRANFDEVIRARLALLEQELAVITLRREHARSTALLAYLSGGMQP